MIGLDTGFFFLLSDANSAATRLLERIIDTDEVAAVSSIAIYEVFQPGMRGALPSDVVDLVIDNVTEALPSRGSTPSTSCAEPQGFGTAWAFTWPTPSSPPRSNA